MLYVVILTSRAQALHMHTPGPYSSFYTKIYSLSVDVAKNSYGKKTLANVFLFFLFSVYLEIFILFLEPHRK